MATPISLPDLLLPFCIYIQLLIIFLNLNILVQYLHTNIIKYVFSPIFTISVFKFTFDNSVEDFLYYRKVISVCKLIFLYYAVISLTQEVQTLHERAFLDPFVASSCTVADILLILCVIVFLKRILPTLYRLTRRTFHIFYLFCKLKQQT